ncbi:ABC transporter substrate-binding protein [Pedococcus sp. P5_B7]
MNKRLLAFACVLSVSAMALVGCSDKASSSKSEGGRISVLRVGSGSVSSLNYAKNYSAIEQRMGYLVFETLVVLDDENKVKPWLAESWSQTDPTTYVYKLRHGVKFSDGSKMTAQDVVFSYDLYRQPGSPQAFRFPASLKSITAVDDYTVQVKLSEPNAAWAVIAADGGLGVLSKAFYEANKATYGQPGTGAIGTGPWQLTSLDPTTGAEFATNPNYWGSDVPIDKISWRFFSNESSEAVAFRAGQIDVAFPSDTRAWSATAGADPQAGEGGSQADVHLNTLVKPWNDVHVRRAVAYALNKDALMNAYGAQAEPLESIIPPHLLLTLGSQKEVNDVLASMMKYPYDVNKAKEEMAQSAYPNGVDVEFTASDVPAESNTAQAIVQMLAKVGIRAKLNVEQLNPWLDHLTDADRKAVPSGFWVNGGVGPDPGVAYDSMIGSRNATGGNWNVTNWSTPAVDGLIANGFSATDPAQRLKVYEQLVQQFADNLPYVPLFLVQPTVALSKSISWPSFSDNYESRGPWPLKISAK